MFVAEEVEAAAYQCQYEEHDDDGQMARGERDSPVGSHGVLDYGRGYDAGVGDLVVAVYNDRYVELAALRREQTVIGECLVVQEYAGRLADRSGICAVAVDLGVTVDVLEGEVYELQVVRACKVSEVHAGDRALAVHIVAYIAEVRRPVVPSVLPVVVVPSAVAAVDADVLRVCVIFVGIKSEPA